MYEAPGFSVHVPDDDWANHDTATTHFLQRTGKGQEALLVLSQDTKNDEELTSSGKELFASSVDEMAYFVQSARYDSGAFENERTTTFNGIDSILFDGQFEFSTRTIWQLIRDTAFFSMQRPALSLFPQLTVQRAKLKVMSFKSW